MQRAQQHLLGLARAREGNRAQHHIHGRIDQHAGGRPVLAPEDASTGRIRRRRSDARSADRVLVAPERVDVDAGERNRMPRRPGAEQRKPRELVPRPAVLVPPAAANPCPLRHGGGESDHAVDALLLRGRAREPDFGLRPRVQQGVTVGVDETRNGAALPQLDELQVAARLALALLARAHPGKPAVPDQHCGRAGPFRVQRVQCSRDEEIGHRETSGLFPRYMTQMDARHHLDGKLLVALAAAAVAGVLFWNTWPLYPLKLLVVLIDRKSTRLNSSHLVISYAVFCLKKKKKHNLNMSVT